MKNTIIRGNNIKNGLVATVGFILSPLSWWNDLVVNIPIAYLFSIPFSFISESLFIPGFIIGYWLSNLIGLLMIHSSITNYSSKISEFSREKSLLISIFYSMLIVIFSCLGWIEPPTKYIQ
ncbi:MAG: hypothetical protein OEX07_06855 [Gammaproteobacteria bacterium]|nr:hypothetical protein [Gammaproteobacteria bacterium]